MTSEISNRPGIDKDALVNVINQIFAEFELVYHNQYHKAFPNPEKLNYAKKIWLGHLADHPPQVILQAAHRAIKDSEFLPTIKGILKHCNESFGLPEARAAYIEACRAGSPKSEYNWSHPAVYFAGRESDWYFLASASEQQAFPVFKRNYQLVCDRVLAGEQLAMPLPKALPESINTPLSNSERKERMKDLREELKL
jgi:Replication protein P